MPPAAAASASPACFSCSLFSGAFILPPSFSCACHLPTAAAAAAAAITLKVWTHVGDEPEMETVILSSEEDFQRFIGSARLHLMERVEDGPSKRVCIITRLDQAVQACDNVTTYLFLDEPSDRLTRQVKTVINAVDNQETALEEQTTKAMYANPSLQKELGGLELVNGGHPFTFYKGGYPYLEIDGALKNSRYLVLNSVKLCASVSHVADLQEAVRRLSEVIKSPSAFGCRVFKKQAPGLLAEVAQWQGFGIIPFLSSFCFLPPVEEACLRANIRMMRTDGTGYSPASPCLY